MKISFQHTMHTRRAAGFAFSPGLILVLLLLSYAGWGQQKTWIGPNNGTWDTGANWSPAGVPGAINDVVINTSRTINVDVNATINRLTINGGATVTFSASGGGRIIIMDNSSNLIEAGSTLTLQGSSGSGTRSMTLAFSGSNQTMSIAGTLELTDVGEGSIYSATNSLTTVTGTLRNDGTAGGTDATITSTAGNLTFASGGTYEHALNGGTIPTATWNAASNCNITGMTNSDPGGDGQAFGNLIYNCSGMSGDRNMAGSGLTIAGNLEVLNTGSGILRMSQTPLTVSGNCIMGDNFRIGSGSPRTLNVTGDFIMNGGILEMADNDQVGILSVTGNFSATAGTLTETGDASGLIVFPAGTHNYTSGATVSNIINHTINSGSTVEILSGSTLRNGTGCTLTNNGTIKGNGTIINSGTFTPSAASFLAPGASVGTLSVTGTLNLGACTYACEINGAAGTPDVLAISGAATLTNAKLVVSWLSNPVAAGTYTVMTFASRTGNFATVTIPPVTGYSFAAVYTATQVQITATALPVELVSFNAKVSAGAGYLDWTTATESNNSHFAIERGADARTFSEIGQVRGAGTTQEPQSYTFTDEKPLSGTNYYRLRQVDYDGTESFSQVVSVAFGKSDRITIAPSPATDRVRILLEEAPGRDAYWKVYDSMGREIRSGAWEVESAEYELDVNELPEGMYTFRLEVGASVQVKQFRKL